MRSDELSRASLREAPPTRRVPRCIAFPDTDNSLDVRDQTSRARTELAESHRFVVDLDVDPLTTDVIGRAKCCAEERVRQIEIIGHARNESHGNRDRSKVQHQPRAASYRRSLDQTMPKIMWHCGQVSLLLQIRSTSCSSPNGRSSMLVVLIARPRCVVVNRK
jgi:hypothetical protein